MKCSRARASQSRRQLHRKRGSPLHVIDCGVSRSRLRHRGLSYDSRPNGSASEMRSTPRLSRCGRTSYECLFKISPLTLRVRSSKFFKINIVVISPLPCREQKHRFFGLPGETAVNSIIPVKYSGPSPSSLRRSKYGEVARSNRRVSSNPHLH